MPLGQWIFEEACRQLHTWHQEFPELQHLTMSVNLSNRQFGQSDLVNQIESTIRETGVRGDCVRLEITESMVMGDVDAAIDLMLRLKIPGPEVSHRRLWHRLFFPELSPPLSDGYPQGG